MPVLLQAILIIGGVICIAVAVQSFVRRRVPLEILKEHHEVAGVLMGLVGGMYGILVAFVVVALWSDFEDARENVAAEANALADLGRLTAAFPAPTGPAIRSRIFAYFDVVMTEEWPLMRERETSPRAAALVDGLWTELTRFEPQTTRERNLHLAALGALDQFSDHRRTRLVVNQRELPALVWAILILGGVIVLGFANFFGLRFPRSQLVMTGAMAAIIGLALFTVYALQHPYRGDVRVSTEEMREVMRLFDDRG